MRKICLFILATILLQVTGTLRGSDHPPRTTEKNILIHNVTLRNKITDILITGNRISRIEPGIRGSFDTVIDGTGLAALPPFYNTHCHAAMTLLRGYADDLALFDWLQNHIWPAEAKLTEDDIYWGTKLACMEMIRSGTVFFSDMYFMPGASIRAVEETGMRAAIGLSVMEVTPELDASCRRNNRTILQNRHKYSSRIQLVWAPHSIYSVSEKRLREVVRDAAGDGRRIHIHLAETRKEFEDCRKKYGCTPVALLDKIGMLSERTILAHAIYLTDEDAALVAKRKVVLSHLPCSNVKLCSGLFRYKKNRQCGTRITIGTDGASSSNSLSVFDAMRSATFIAKTESGDSAVGKAEEIFRAATLDGAEAFGIDAGRIEVGRLADIMLVDLNAPALVPCHSLVSNLVYAADSSCVSTVICDGRILMRNREIPGYRETLENIRRCTRKLKRNK